MQPAKNVYIRFRKDVIPAELIEGHVYPLLELTQFDDNTRMVSWALLTKKSTAAGMPQTNQLLTELLQTLGFVRHDVKAWNLPGTETPGDWDLYALGEDGPWFNVSGLPQRTFDASAFLDHLPKDPGQDDKYTILAPADGEPALTLKVDGPQVEVLANGKTPKVLGFEYVTSDKASFFSFGTGINSAALPGFTCVCGINSLLKSGGKLVDFLCTDALQFKFSCQSLPGADSLASPLLVDDVHPAVISDAAEAGLRIGNKALELVKEGVVFKLAFAFWAGIRFAHNKVPVELTLRSPHLVCRFNEDSLVVLYRKTGAETCFTLSVVSPMLQASGTSGGFSSTLPCLEPFQAQVKAQGKVTIEDDNDLLVFTTRICLGIENEEVELLQFKGSALTLNWDMEKWKKLVQELELPGVSLPKFNRVSLKGKKLSNAVMGLNWTAPPFGTVGINPKGWKISLKLPDGKRIIRWIEKFSADFTQLTVLEPIEEDLPDPVAIEIHCQYRARAAALDSITLDLKGLKLSLPQDLSFIRIRVRQSHTQEVLTRRVKELTWDAEFPKFTVDRPWDGPLPDSSDFEVDVLFELPDLGLPKYNCVETTGRMLSATKIVFNWTTPRPSGPSSIDPYSWKLSITFPDGRTVTRSIKELSSTFNEATLFEGLNFDPSISLKLKIHCQYRVKEADKNSLRIDLKGVPLGLPDDLSRLKLRILRISTDQVWFRRVERVDDQDDFPRFRWKDDLDLPKPIDSDFQVDIFQDWTQPLMAGFLDGLLGGLAPVQFSFSIPHVDAFGLDIPQWPILQLPFEVRLIFPGLDGAKHTLDLWVSIGLDLTSFRLSANRLYFYLPSLRPTEGTATAVEPQCIDLDIFTLAFHARTRIEHPPSKGDHDGYLDLEKRELVIDFRNAPDPNARIRLFFPGGLSAQDVKELSKPDSKKSVNRFTLELEKFAPASWPNEDPDLEKNLQFRLNPQGVTLKAEISKNEVLVDGSPSLVKAFKFQPQDTQGLFKSRIVIIDNQIREAAVYATTFVPGVEKLLALIGVSLRQPKPGVIPDVIAEMRLEKPDESPIADLSMGSLQMKLKTLKLDLAWLRSKHDWDYQAIADGSISFTGAADLIPDLEGLRAPNAIEVIGLDLRNLNIKELKVPLKLTKPARFEMLSGQFVVELGDLELAWVFDGKLPRPRLLNCSLAKFTFKNPGVMDVSIGVGGLHIEFDDNFHVKIALPSRLSIEANVSKAAGFLGDVGWVDDAVKKERYFFASGRLSLEGMPEVEALLKIGTGVKYNGQTTLNFAIYGGMDIDTEIFPGVVVKNLGVGMGINNRLALISSRPSVDEMLQRIDLMDPARIDSWNFVREDGLYVSVVAKTFLGSNQGKPDAAQAYVAMLVLSLDTNFDLIAAGKFWVSSSLKGVKDHLNSPLLVGAALMSLRNQKVEMALESRPNPYIEDNPFLQKLMGNVSFRFSFRLAPGLVDYYMERITYSENFLGATFSITGSYRVAIFRSTLLVRAGLTAIGSVSKELSCGCGGFRFQGSLLVDAGYGGLLSQNGALFYAYLEASLSFSVSAWIEIGFSKSFKICGKKITIEWSVKFTARAPSLELRLRGQIGMKYEGSAGSVGFFGSLGIDYSICGYRLQFAGQIEDRPQIFQEVLERVTAFEKDLNDYIQGTETAFAALTAKQEPGLSDARVLELASDAARRRPDADREEKWLHYVRPQKEGDFAFHLLVPDSSAPWLTPVHADITEIVSADGSTLRIWSQNHGLTIDHVGKVKIATVGIRGYYDGSRKWVAAGKANGSWDLVGVDTEETGTLDLQTASKVELPASRVKLFGGTWYVQSYDANPVPHLVNDVQAIAIGHGDKDVENEDAIDIVDVKMQAGQVLITTKQEHKLEAGSRVLVFNGPQIFAPNAHNFSPRTPPVLRPHLTWSTESPAGPADKTLILAHCTDPGNVAAGWQLRPAKEVWTPWNAENLGRLRGGATKLLENNEVSGGNGNILSDDVYVELRGLAPMFVESSRPSSSEVAEVPDHNSYLVADDPRIPNTSRDLWNLEARYKNPDYAIPYDFRPIEQLVQEGDSAGNIQEIFDYEKLVERARQAAMHKGLDLEDAEQLHRSRAVLTHLLTDDLSAPQGPERFGEAKLENGAPVDLAMGSIFKLPKDKSPKTVFIRRAGGKSVPIGVNLIDPDKDLPNSEAQADPIDFIQRFPIRQAFVVQDRGTNAPDAKERAKVVVKLPIGIHQDLLRQSPASLGHFQIFRQFPWDEKPVLRRDFVRPDVTFLEGPRTVERGTCRLVDAGGLKLTSDSEPSELNGSRREGLHIVVDSLTAKGETGPLAAKILSYDTDSSTVAIDADLESPVAGTEEGFAYSITEQGKILVNPYIFTDEYPVENRQFSDKTLVAKGLRPGETEILYSLRFVPQGEHETVEDPTGAGDGRYGGWGPVRLHIPAPEDFPQDLAMVLPVESLIHTLANGDDPADKDFGILEVVAMKDGVPHKPSMGGRLLGCDDFELWAQQLPLRQTGFYGGSEAGPVEQKPVDSSTVTLKRVDPEQFHESADHKIKIRHRARNDGHWQILNAGDFPSGFGYRLFIRPSKYADINLLTPLPCFLVRELPKEWTESVRMKPVEQVEFFGEALVTDIQRHEAKMLDATEFGVDDLYEEGSNRLRVTWESQSLFDGGVELVFRDDDDSSLVRRQMCEVIEALQYRLSRRDFSGASIWTLSPADRRERVPDRGEPPPHEAAPKPLEYLTNHFFSEDEASRKVYDDLEGSYKNLNDNVLKKAAQPPAEQDGGYDWKDDLVPLGQRFVAALYQFLRSPLNLNDPTVNNIIRAMLLNLRALMVGLSVPQIESPVKLASIGDVVTGLKEQIDTLQALLRDIDKLDTHKLPSDEAGTIKALDTDFAKSLAAVTRRRITTADDLLGLVPSKQIPNPDPSKDRRDPSPRQKRWDDLETESGTFGFEFPNTNTLLGMVSKINLKVAATNLQTLYQGETPKESRLFMNLIRDRQELATVLPRAARLAEFLKRLEKKLESPDGPTLVKRPHHELATGTDAQGTTIQLPTPIRTCMPDEARAHKPEEPPPLPGTGFIRSGNRVVRLVTVATEGAFHKIRIWATRGKPGSERQVLMQTLDEPASANVRSVEVAHSGEHHLLVVCLEGGRVSVWDILQGERLIESETKIDAAIFAETPKGLSVLCAEQQVVEERDPFRPEQWKKQLDPSQPRTLASFKQREPGEAITSLAYDSKKHVLVAGTETGLALMWRYGDPSTPYRRLAHHTWQVMVKSKDEFALVDDSIGNGKHTPGTGTWTRINGSETRTGKVDAATWASPIVIRSESHGLKALDTIGIKNVEGNTAANGDKWVVRVIDAHSFEILEPSKGTMDAKGGFWWRAGSLTSSEIASASKDCPIVITSPDHNLKTWDRVNIRGVVGNTAANNLTDGLASVKIAPMPHGRRVLTAGKDAVRLWHTPDTRPARLVFAGGTGGAAEAITSVAFDGKGLQLAIGTSQGRALVWSVLAQLEPAAYAPEEEAIPGMPCSVSFAHKGEKVYLFASYSTPATYLWNLSGDTKPVAPVNGEPVTMVTAALMPQVSATAARNVVAYFNLLERLGFALDIAIVDAKNQLVQQKTLIDFLKPDLKGVLNENCYGAMLLGQEPDAEYDPEAPLGFSFVKVALVPKDFHHLCLRVKPIMGRVPKDAKCTNFTIVLDEKARKQDLKGHVVAIVKGKGKGKSRKIQDHNSGDATARIQGQWSGPNDNDIPDETSEYLIADVNPDSEYVRLIHWFDFRGIKLHPDLSIKMDGNSVSIDSSNSRAPVEEIMVEPLIYLMHIREMAQYARISEKTEDGFVTLSVQPRAERWLTVPAVGRKPHSAWTVPDRKGYRFKTAVRKVSRYEPLLQWASGFRTPVPVAKEQPVLAGNVDSTAPLGSSKLFLDQPLSTWDGVTPLRVEITDGPGAGQHRAITAVDGDNRTLVIDQADPWLADIQVGATYRIMGEAAYWTPISVPPVLDPMQGEGSKALTVYTYPHPSRVMFSYQLPTEGARSIYNQISAIRTGYKGTDLVFRYDLVDRDSLDPQNLVRLLEKMQKVDNPNVPEPQRRLGPVPINNESGIRLFRHERMVSLPDLPFFYRYRMDARSLFATRPVDTVELQPSEILPLDPDRSPSAERGPSQLNLFQPTIRTAWKGACRKRDGLSPLQVALDPTGWPDFWGKAWVSHPSLVRLTVTKQGTAEQASSLVQAFDDTRLSIDGVVIVTVTQPWDVLPDEQWIYKLEPGVSEVTIYLSRNCDHLTKAEADAQPYPLDVGFRGEWLQAPQLPDFVMDYGLFWQMLPPPGELHIPAGWVRMPWSKEYPASLLEDMKNRQQPYVKVSQGLSVPTDPTKVESGGSGGSVQIEYFDPGEGAGATTSNRRVYRVRFPLRVTQGSSYYQEASKFFLQGFRNKLPSKELQFKELGHA
jgi:hypothetical protein